MKLGPSICLWNEVGERNKVDFSRGPRTSEHPGIPCTPPWNFLRQVCRLEGYKSSVLK